MTNSLSLALANAPVDDEELIPEAAAELDRARESLARGEGIPHEEILKEFGLTWEDWDLMGQTPLDAADSANREIRSAN